MTGDVLKKIAEASVELVRLGAIIEDSRSRKDWNTVGVATCRRRDLVWELAEVLTKYGEDLLASGDEPWQIGATVTEIKRPERIRSVEDIKRLPKEDEE